MPAFNQEHLKQFRFKPLFNELGWDLPAQQQPYSVAVGPTPGCSMRWPLKKACRFCSAAPTQTGKASKMLVAWRDQGLLVPLPDRAKRNMAYTKPVKAGVEQGSLLSGLEDNNCENVS